MNDDKLIGVVTVTYNSAEVLLPFLGCVANQTHRRFRLIVVDNDSKDATLHILKAFSDDRIVTISNANNLGVAEGNNQGIIAALHENCDYVLLLNNDTEFSPSLFEELVGGLEKTKVEMISPKIMYYDQPCKIWAAGGTFQSRYGYRSIHFGEGEIDRGQFNNERLVTYVPTCCVLIKRRVFEKIGLMDARYFVYVDDVDFMYRALRAEVKLLYYPTSTLLHKVSSLTGREPSISMIRFCTRNRAFFLLKHFGLIRSLPLHLAYQVHFLIDLIIGKLSPEIYREKRKAVVEGFAMWRVYRRSARAASHHL